MNSTIVLPVDGLLLVLIIQWDNKGSLDMNPVPNRTGISYERQQV